MFFSKIFKNGNYNCVTATALYCYVFEKLDIPYKVKDLPTHVYLVAYPDLYNIKLEITVPREYGYYAPNEENIKRAVDELISMRLITPDELNKKGYKNMYESYFYGNSALKKESLMIQTSFYSYIYLTAGRYFYGKNRFAEAKALFKKDSNMSLKIKNYRKCISGLRRI